MMTKISKNTKSFLTAFGALLFGGIIGTGFGLLVAPRSGKNTRRLIRRKSEQIKDRAVDSLIDTREQALESMDALTEEAKYRADNVAEQSKDLFERQKANAREKLRAVR
jgi:gas vesicle protein